LSAYLNVKFTVTLMRPTEMDIYVESGDRVYDYYYRVPMFWLSDPELQRRAYDIAHQIYGEHYRRFRIAEPSDLSYLLVKHTYAIPLSPAEAAARPWLMAQPPVWESSLCFAIDNNGAYTRVAPQAFDQE
jgi:hypothetical protein